jgi:tetratricopeptide (TPR) repeat protein
MSMESDDVQSVLNRANEFLEAGRPEESLRCLAALENALFEPDERVEWAALKAWALSELGRGNDALDVLEPMLGEFPQSARLHGTLGVVLSNDGDLDEACDALEQAVALDEADEVALANLGLVYEKLRQYEHAFELYNQAIEMGAEIDWLLQRTAAVQAELGDLAAARSTLKRYLSLVPEDADQWIALAILHSDDLEFDQAFRCYRAAEQVAPDSAALRLNWGVTAVRAHQADAAQRQLRYLERLEPDSSRRVLLEAFIHEEQGRLDQALQGHVDALARVRREDRCELTYALEMAMDFFARHQRRGPCEQLMEQAYILNACTVEICEAYREITGKLVKPAHWYSLILEADYRAGLEEVLDPGDAVNRPYSRFLRNYQIVARNHDEAVLLAMQFARRMGEMNVQVREFVSEEEIAPAHLGVYEVERESLVFVSDGSA